MRRSTAALLGLGCLSFGPAFGQTPPGTANPGRIDDRFKPPAVPQSKPEISIPEPAFGAAPQATADTQFDLAGVVIDGSTVFTPADFAPLYQSLVGKQVSLADMYRLRDAISAKYRSAGYVLSQASLPPQTIAGGVVHLTVIEGYIDHVTVDDAALDPRGLIAATAANVTRSRPLRAQDLERAILLINDIPGVSASTVLKPSDRPGASDLAITVSRQAVSGQAGVDNRGSQAIGPVQFFAGLSFNSLLGLDEQTSLLFATAAPTRELVYFSARHEQVLNPQGLRLILSGSFNHSQPGGAIAALDARGRGTVVSVELVGPVIRTRAKTLKLGLGLTAMNTSTDLLSVRFSQDRVRFASASASYDFSDEALGSRTPASTLLRVELDQGLSIFNASANGSALLSRANGRSDFTSLSGELTRIQSLGRGASVALSAAGLYAFVPLLSSQQFGLGGRRFGRGYEPSELTGDNGISYSIEPRFDLSGLIPAGHPQLYTFYEGGTVWQKQPLAGQAARESLSSVGGGVRFELGRYLRADVGAAKPLTHDIASRGNRKVRFLFDLTAAF